MSKKNSPSMEQWLKEAKQEDASRSAGMYLFHNGIVRQSPKAQVREGVQNLPAVKAMNFSYDQAKVDAIIEQTYRLEGICHVRVWLNSGELTVGDDIMYVLVGGDIRPHVIDALQYLVGRIKNECVVETEIYE